jgi:DNA-binding response OmpR family regulator
MQKKLHILLIEDEENFGLVLKNYLELSQYIVTLCTNGKLGLKAFKNDVFDICICDVMMPEMDGFTVAKEIRKINSQTPFIFLTAKTQKHDLIKGYELGADDYVTKPFDTEVLLLKIKAVLNRSSNTNKKQCEYQIGKFTFKTTTRELIVETKKTKLSPKEASLLALLCENMNEVVTRELALNKIWNDNNYFTTRSMDVFIAKLRKHLNPDKNIEIINVHGNGFRLLVS